MKIDNSIKSTVSPGTKETGARPTRSSPGGSPPQSAAKNTARDDVKITSLSSQLQALESSLSNLDVADAARVDAIKQVISEGRFKVDNGVVADRLLNTVKELLAKYNKG